MTLQQNLIKYRLMDKHIELVNKGEFRVASMILRLLRDKRVTCYLDDISYQVEMICEKCNCRIWYSNDGNRAVVHI